MQGEVRIAEPGNSLESRTPYRRATDQVVYRSDGQIQRTELGVVHQPESRCGDDLGNDVRRKDECGQDPGKALHIVEGKCRRESDEELEEMAHLSRDAVIALKSAYRCDGVNVGLNLGRAAGAGVPDHLHTHVLPRWDADSNFMTSIALARVLPEPLDATLQKVRAAWPT